MIRTQLGMLPILDRQDGRRLLAVMMLVALSTLVGCQPNPPSEGPQSPVAPGASGQPGVTGQADALTGDGTTTTGSSAPDAGTSPSSDASGTNKKPSLDVRTLSLQSAEAKEALYSNFENFLDRESLDFQFSDLWSYITSIPSLQRTVVDGLDELRAMSTHEVVDLGVPFLIVALFFVAYAAVRRPIRRLSHRAQARIHIDSSEWLTRVLRGMVMVVARSIPLLILIGVSYFPVQAIFSEGTWPLVVSDCLWLLLAYRAATATSIVTFSGRIIDLEDGPASTLERFVLAGIRLVFAYLTVLVVLDHLPTPEEVIGMVEFAFRLAFLFVPIYALTIRDAITTLLPDDIDSRLYQFFRDILIQNFRPLMAFAAILFGFRAAGYERASTFVLARGTGLILITGLIFIVGSKLRQYLRGRLETVSDVEETGPLETDREKLVRRIEQLLTATTIFVVIISFLKLTALFEPTVLLLRTPFLAIGGARISFLHIINLGLIIFGAVLATRVVRTVLNTQIYPYLEVDVGVAYAINTIANYVLVVVAFFIGLNALGVDLTAITVVIASLGVGIGFGLQTLVENLISGFIILFGRSVQKGDYITVNDTYGQIDAVGARSVVVKTPDNYELLIPSKDIVSAQVINWTYEDNTIRTRLPVGVSYGEDPAEIREILLDVTDEHPMILDEPEPHVRLKGFGDSSVNFELFFYFEIREWTENRVLGEVNFAVWDALKDAGITIPFPQRDVHFKSLDNSDEFQRGFGQPTRPEDSSSSPPPEAERSEADRRPRDRQQPDADDDRSPSESDANEADTDASDAPSDDKPSESPPDEYDT